VTRTNTGKPKFYRKIDFYLSVRSGNKRKTKTLSSTGADIVNHLLLIVLYISCVVKILNVIGESNHNISYIIFDYN